MSLFLLGVKREWQRLLTQPAYWAALFALPLICCGVVIAVFWTSHINDVPMDVVDLDQSSASREMLFKLDASPSVEVQQVLPSVALAKERVLNHESIGYLLIPEGLQRSLATGESVEVNAYVNQQAFMLGNILSSSVLGNVIRASLQESAVSLMADGQMSEQALANVYPLSGISHALGNSYLNYWTFILAALLPHLWHVIVLAVSIMVLGKEFKDGTIAEWYELHDRQLALALLSKYLIPTVILALWITGIYIFLFAQSAIGSYGSLGSLLVAAYMTQLCYQCIGVVIVSVLSSYRMALSMGAFYTTPAFAFIGVSYPTFNMNWFSQAWQVCLPVTTLIQIQNDVMHWQKGWYDIVPMLIPSAGFALMMGLIGLIALGPRIYNQDLWYQH